MDDICLNEIEVSGMVDYFIGSTIQLEYEILLHVENCYKCKQEIIDNWMLLMTYDNWICQDNVH